MKLKERLLFWLRTYFNETTVIVILDENFIQNNNKNTTSNAAEVKSDAPPKLSLRAHSATHCAIHGYRSELLESGFGSGTPIAVWMSLSIHRLRLTNLIVWLLLDAVESALGNEFLSLESCSRRRPLVAYCCGQP